MVQPDGFGFTSLRGNAPEGWDVELYRNGILTDFLIVGASGSYEFPRVELGFGENILRSVAYGPQGQVHERVERHRIGADMLLPGQLRYRFFAVRPDRAPPGRLDPRPARSHRNRRGGTFTDRWHTASAPG